MIQDQHAHFFGITCLPTPSSSLSSSPPFSEGYFPQSSPSPSSSPSSSSVSPMSVSPPSSSTTSPSSSCLALHLLDPCPPQLLSNTERSSEGKGRCFACKAELPSGQMCCQRFAGLTGFRRRCRCGNPYCSTHP